MNRFLDSLQYAFLTVFYSGTVPKAPWTFGSIVSFLLLIFGFFYLGLSVSRLASIVILVAFLGTVSIFLYERDTGQHDDPSIVIDEFVWVWIVTVSVLTYTQNMYFLMVWLIWFRVFDIWKPGPIGYADKKIPWAVWVMLDDVIAGIIAWVVTLLFYFLSFQSWVPLL